MNLRAIADKTIVPAKNKKVLLKDPYKTKDIVSEVFQCFKNSADQVKKFAPYLQGHNVKDTCKSVWNFLKNNIRYEVDPPETQWVKEPAKVWHDKVCDCKSYSIFIAALLKALDINGVFRFVSFNLDPAPTHVYIVVRNQGKDIIIDDVMDKFDKEKPFTYKKDYPMSGLYRVSGITQPPTPKGGQRRLPVVGSLPVIDGIGCPGKTSCSCNNAEISGLLDPIRRLLSGSKAKDLLIQLAPLWLYAYLPQPHGGFKDSSAAGFWGRVPSIVKMKMHGLVQLGEWVNDHWGFTNSKAGEIQYSTIKQLLGMPPQKYLALTISPDIMNYRDNSVFCSHHNHCLSGIGQGGILSTALGLLQGIKNALIDYNIPANLQPDVIGPLPSDWRGYKTRIPLGVVPPTPADPLGAGINNGLYSGNGAPTPAALHQYQIPVFDLQGNRVNIQPENNSGGFDYTNEDGTQPKEAGMSPLLMLGLGGAAIALVASSGKKKKHKK